MTAEELLETKTVRCRTCGEDVAASSVKLTTRAWRNPGDGKVCRAAVAFITARCVPCVEETTMSLLL